MKITITQGHVDQRGLNFEPHRRGTNWIATVEFNPAERGGLHREFWAKGSGSYRAVPEDLLPGDIIEVADDYTSSSGNKRPSRHYYRITRYTADVIEVEEMDEAPGPDTVHADEWSQDQNEDHGNPPHELAEYSDEDIIREALLRGLSDQIMARHEADLT